MIVRLDLSYDGSHFYGWQSQEGQHTVQNTVEAALERIFKRRPRLYTAGRTDTGVHARHQCCAFFTERAPPPEVLMRALRAFLPRTIDVWRVSLAPEDFHPRRSALARCYEYLVDPRPRAEPWHIAYRWVYSGRLEPSRMQAMAALILGEHDFSGFCSAQDPSPSKSRLVMQSHWRSERGLWVYRVTANAFLWRMVRRLVGAMVRLSARPDGVEIFHRMLENPGGRVPATAPAAGLYLHKVVYHADDFPH